MCAVRNGDSVVSPTYYFLLKKVYSFAYVDPILHHVYPMPGITAQDYLDITNVKQLAPGLLV